MDGELLVILVAMRKANRRHREDQVVHVLWLSLRPGKGWKNNGGFHVATRSWSRDYGRCTGRSAGASNIGLNYQGARCAWGLRCESMPLNIRSCLRIEMLQQRDGQSGIRSA